MWIFFIQVELKKKTWFWFGLKMPIYLKLCMEFMLYSWILIKNLIWLNMNKEMGRLKKEKKLGSSEALPVFVYWCQKLIDKVTKKYNKTLVA